MYALSFTEDFFTGNPDGELGGDDLRNFYPVSDRPQCVLQALISEEVKEPAYFREMVKDTLGYSLPIGQPVDETVFFDPLEKIRKYSTCNTLTPPIDVYVDDHYYVTVYEDREEEVA